MNPKKTKTVNQLPSDPLERMKVLSSWHCRLIECAAILKEIPYRRLLSWTTGPSLRIRPSGGRARYGLPNLLQFTLCSRLLDAGLGLPGVQYFLSHFLDADFLASNLATKLESWLIVRESEKSEGHLVAEMYSDPERFLLALKIYSATPLRFVVVHLGETLNGVLRNLESWLERREPLSPSAGKQAAKALRSLHEKNFLEGNPIRK
jgi:hypothetical protein